MSKTWILLLTLILFTLTSSVASAQYAKPGTMIPLKITDYSFRTSHLIIPIDAWYPSHIRWILWSPTGLAYFVDGPCDNVRKVRSYYEGAEYFTDWEITDNSGYIKVPAFAKEGQWTLFARFYDRLLGIVDFHSDTEPLYSFQVGDVQFYDQLNGPFYITFSIPFMGDFAFATPDLIIMFGIVFVFVIILINLKAFLSRGRKNVTPS